jgi:thiamine transporter ThiT
MGAAGIQGLHFLAGVFFACVPRFFCHALSGAVFFAGYVPEGQNPLVYLILYNGAYLIPSTAASSIMVWLLWGRGSPRGRTMMKK